MRKLILILSVLFPTLVFAQGGLNPIAVNGDNVSLNVPSGGSFAIVQGSETRYKIGSTGVNSHPAYIVTPALTAVAGTNDIRGRVNVFVGAAANTAALLPSSPTAGMLATIINSGANTVKVRVGTTETMNSVGTPGASLGAPLATLGIMECVATSATNWQCVTGAVATPAA